MGGGLMQARNSRVSRRQPAVRILAQEFGESTLSEKGPGEFDPAFVITKLGAKVNRLLVAGLLERMEPRDTTSGTMWQGQLRDASGVHYFNIGHFDNDVVQAQAEGLAKLHENGDPLLLLMTTKGRCYTTEEGNVYTNMRPEEIAIIDRSRYADWLVEACESTMKRVADHDAAAALAPSREAYAEAGIAEHMIEGLLTAREFYGEVDSEVHRLMVRRALDIAEGKRDVGESSWGSPATTATLDVGEMSSSTGAQGNEQDLDEVVLSIIEQLDEGKGVALETMLAACAVRGFDQRTTESALDGLVSQGTLVEPRFAWFKMA